MSLVRRAPGHPSVFDEPGASNGEYFLPLTSSLFFPPLASPVLPSVPPCPSIISHSLSSFFPFSINPSFHPFSLSLCSLPAFLPPSSISDSEVTELSGRSGSSQERICNYCCLPESSVATSCLTLCDPVDCSPPGSSVQGILPARTVERVATSFSRASSRPRDGTHVSLSAAPAGSVLK